MEWEPLISQLQNHLMLGKGDLLRWVSSIKLIYHVENLPHHKIQDT